VEIASSEFKVFSFVPTFVHSFTRNFSLSQIHIFTPKSTHLARHEMKYPSLLLRLLALPGLLSATPLLPRQAVGISPEDFTKVTLYEQFAAAAYCRTNFAGKIGDRLRCDAGNCPDVQSKNTSILRSFDK
jgi:hypothetical protein